MRKIHALSIAGAAVVGLGAVAGLATFAPSLASQKTGTHELTVQIPGGGTEAIVYSGNIPPKVTFHNGQFATPWQSVPAWGWTIPSFVRWDPFIADIHRHLDMWATPLVIPSAPELQGAATLKGLPRGTSYWMVTESNINGLCARFTQITETAGDAQPKVVSQTSGSCGTGSNQSGNYQPSQAAKQVNLPRLITPATMQSM